MKPGITAALAAAGMALAGSIAAPLARAAEPFMLSSPALQDNGLLAVKNAGNDARSPNCVGANVSPPLAWVNPPEGTKSFALMLVDPEGGLGLGAVHFVAYGIPPEVTGFAEGEVSKPSDKFVGGSNGRGFAIYSGPCPSPGGWHHYTFTLIATDLEPKALPAGLTRDQLFAQLKGHAKAAAGLIGRFKHQ